MQATANIFLFSEQEQTKKAQKRLWEVWSQPES
jgi:hypothetical protein